jgi:HEPN/Toprim N-terminal domain 1
MGTYTNLTVAGYPIIESKSAVVPEALTIFRETDRRVFTRRVSERNALVWGEPEDPNDEETETVIEYSCETGKVIDRLNVMGFTLRRVREAFDIGRKSELEKYESWAQEDSDSQWFAEAWNFLKGLTFDAYATALAKVIADGLRPVPFDDHKKEGLDPVIKYILSENDEYLFGFPGTDVRLLLRLACDLVPANSRVVQDITDLVHAGYYGEEEPVCEHATRTLTAGHPENSPRIILTEGSTDAAILNEALALLYPHLSAYYSFLDFDSSRSPGGAGHLVSLVKAFAAAGITNRIVALFDNDTAAREARRALATISLPPNIAVRYHPDLELLKTYPTLGPGGLASLDVNGLAGSIELYLGEDVLREGQDALTPVQWKGYSETLKQYQGEVMRKTKLHSMFNEKVARCKVDPDALKATDWSGLSAILQEIFRAFE